MKASEVRPTVLLTALQVTATAWGGHLDAQAPGELSVDIGVGMGAGALNRDSVPATGVYSFSTNSPSGLRGLAAMFFAEARVGRLGLRGEVIVWREVSGETMAGAFGGPVLRLGTRDVLIVELLLGSLGMPLSQEYHPSPEEDVRWWQNPMRTHTGGGAFKVALGYQRAVAGRWALRVRASRTQGSVPGPREGLFEPTSGSRLRYGFTTVDLGLVLGVTR